MTLSLCKHHNLPTTARSGFRFCETCQEELSRANRILGSWGGRKKSIKRLKALAENRKKRWPKHGENSGDK